MRKSLSFASLALWIVAAACSDAPTKAPGLVRSALPLARDIAGDIDAMIIQFFPKGLETATETRWDHIVSELGQWDAVHNTWTGTNAAQGRKHLLDLSKFIQLKTSSVEGPSLCTATKLTNCETQQHAAGRLLLAMQLYVYSGPTATVPAPTPTTDLTVAIVPAGQAATVQAPSKQAGLIIPTGGTSEDRVIVVSKNEQVYPKCSGPLSAYTTRCEYPRYYQIASYPPLPLNTPGRFAVCDYLGGANGALDAENEGPVHERLRLAHEDPALHGGRRLGTENGARYIDNLEILPLIGLDVPGQQTNAAVCNETAWAPTHDGILGLAQVALHSVGSAVGKMLTPKDLYAYDQGVEHSGIDFSDFGSVDPESAPDLAIADVTAPSTVTVGTEMTVSYTVENRSPRNGGNATASSAATTVAAWLSTDQTIDEGDIPLGSATVPALTPDASFPVSHTINAPSTSGPYYVLVKVNANPTITEITLTNNTSPPLRVDVVARVVRDVTFDTDPSGQPISDGTVVTNTYSSWGIIFKKLDGSEGNACGTGPNNVYAKAYSDGAFSSNVVSVCGPDIASDFNETNFGTIQADFTNAASKVCIDVAMPSGYAVRGFLEAFDASGAVLGRTTSTTGVNGTICVSAAGIRGVRFSGDGTNFAEFDNLHVEF